MKKLTALCASLLMMISAHATLLTVELDKADYVVGDSLQANIVISDIEQEFGFQKLLATYDFDLMFDDSLLSYQTTSFGSLLDVDLFFPSDQLVDDSSASTLSLSEISFAFDTDLFAAQDGLSSFVLASVNFEVTSGGINTFSLENISLGDEFGGSFANVRKEPTITNIVNATSVPEMPSLAIFTLGLLVFFMRKFTLKL